MPGRPAKKQSPPAKHSKPGRGNPGRMCNDRGGAFCAPIKHGHKGQEKVGFSLLEVPHFGVDVIFTLAVDGFVAVGAIEGLLRNWIREAHGDAITVLVVDGR